MLDVLLSHSNVQIAKEPDPSRMRPSDVILLWANVDKFKQATGWVAEKASRAKFSDIVSRERDHGAFMALESLTLGVEGKRSMWTVLKEIASQYPALASTNLDELSNRAGAQHAILENERLAAGARALANVG